ncbi:MAG: ATP-binding protein [Bacteroidales bacterium]|nr:ATP-binding protein [Bacteroidales bacterium]
MYIQRKIHPEIRKHLVRKEFTIITGPRQSGKTSLIQDLYRELRNENKTVAYITLEDRDILSAINIHPEEVFSFVKRPVKSLAGTQKGAERVFLFIDEVQYAADPSNFLKYLYDVYGENLKVIATGSSAFYIDSKFKDSLAGRKRIFELKTLSFEEWLLFRDFRSLLGELNLIRSRSEYISPDYRQLLHSFNEYLVYGGYPSIVLENDKEEKVLLLKELKNAFLKKDIDEAGIANPEKFYLLLVLLAGQTGNLVNKNELANTIGVDNKTVDKYLYVLQNCFHIRLVKPFYTNHRKELTKMPKVFFKDSGMRNIVLNRLFDFKDRGDEGQLIENYVFSRLSEIYDKDMIRFWRTTDKQEVDFIVSTSSNEGLALEVKLKCPGVKPAVNKKFIESYPGFQFRIISYALDKECDWILKL